MGQGEVDQLGHAAVGTAVLGVGHAEQPVLGGDLQRHLGQAAADPVGGAVVDAGLDGERRAVPATTPLLTGQQHPVTDRERRPVQVEVGVVVLGEVAVVGERHRRHAGPQRLVALFVEERVVALGCVELLVEHPTVGGVVGVQVHVERHPGQPVQRRVDGGVQRGAADRWDEPVGPDGRRGHTDGDQDQQQRHGKESAHADHVRHDHPVVLPAGPEP